MRKAVSIAVLAATAALVLSGCGASWNETHNYNAPLSGVKNVVPHWTRIDTPYGYPTVIRYCEGTTAVIIFKDGTFPGLIANDPACR